MTLMFDILWVVFQIEAATPEKDRLAAQRVMDQFRRDLEALGHDMDSERNRQLADLQVSQQL
jgi:hypothetical protein